MVQRLQVLCPAHRSHSVLLIHRFRWTPPALSQVTFCQLRSVRLPRSPPLRHSLSVASSLMLPRRPSYQSPPHLWMPLRRLFHTPLPLGTFLRNSRSGVMSSTLRVVPSLLLDAAVQTPSHSVETHDASTQLPLTEFFIGCILSNDPLDRQALPSAHCNAGSASPPPPPDIATLCSPSSASHASDGHEHTTAPHVLLQPPPGLEKCARQFASPLREPTILLVQILVQELVLFLNHEPLFFLWSNLVNPNLTGLVTLIQLTAISCIINTVSLFFSGIQDRPAGTPPILSRQPVESSMRLFFKKASDPCPPHL